MSLRETKVSMFKPSKDGMYNSLNIVDYATEIYGNSDYGLEGMSVMEDIEDDMDEIVQDYYNLVTNSDITEDLSIEDRSKVCNYVVSNWKNKEVSLKNVVEYLDVDLEDVCNNRRSINQYIEDNKWIKVNKDVEDYININTVG